MNYCLQDAEIIKRKIRRMMLYNNNYLPLIYVHVYKNYGYNYVATFSVQTIYLSEVLYSKIGLNLFVFSKLQLFAL
jgi:hypothetical protein